ncbi:chromatin assembly factor 1 subunit B [Sitodiplosis mosellana]|uniref:chromatin assembly factor 1 subunit B n=1 Tax=Sitodiplosis mosellana TaxID=263140 RepID=UPI002444854E|nr:chromatin assembly factor 1 subunit B [Sitodiplosis mosellana]
MKCVIPEISWHNRDPVLSVDIQPKVLEGDNKIRLASGGLDTHVLIWYISENDEGLPKLELASDLARHQKSVMAVRWSPSGQYLASADEEAIFIWKLKGENDPGLFDDSSEANRETWNIFKTLRGHLDDVLDLSWSLDSLYLASGEVGCTAMVWDVMKGKSKLLLNEHKNFVQGVAWDPKDKYLATISSDRTLRFFDSKTGKVLRRINKATYPVGPSSPLFNKNIRLFHDDTLPTFYRRLCYSPDGNLLVVPSGCTDIITSSTENKEEAEKQNENKEDASNGKDEAVEKPEKPEKPEKADKQNKLQNVTYIFTRYSKEPAVIIPSKKHFTLAVRFCPTIFKLRPHNENNPPMIDLPYRMIYAVVSKDSVYLYDTQQRIPFGSISDIHYARLTDVTWSNDGRILIASSFDGFCTLISFEDGELGEVYEKSINLVDTDDKENQTKRKRTSNDGKNKTSPKMQKSDKTEASTPTTSISTKENAQLIVKPKIQIPETIIASAETFESPEYKEKQATPIAIRRAPRTNPSTPSSATATPKSSDTESAALSAKKPKLIAIRRQPRNILPSSPAVVEKSAADQDEALDAWPIPIDTVKTTEEKESKQKPKKDDAPIVIEDETEDMHLVYEGESELTLIKTETISESITKQTDTPGKAITNTPAPEPSSTSSSSNEQSSTPDTKNSKTPRRVQLRTISTPKSKKKLIN